MANEVTDSELQAAAKPFTPVFKVHPDDLLFQYIHRQFGSDGIGVYFRGGGSNAEQVLRAFTRWHGDKPGRILEFASGYGRVTRHAKTVFSDHEYVASDIHPAATDFIRTELGVDAVTSDVDPDKLSIDGSFDFIFVLSLFSHLPDSSFKKWLSVLYDLLAPGGILLFTTHGEFAVDKFPVPFRDMLDLEKGWGYGQDSDQPDLDSDTYGTMVVTTGYVFDAIAQIKARLVDYESGPWFGLQDQWIIKKV